MWHGFASCDLSIAVCNFENTTDAGADPLQPRLEVNGNADGREQAEDVAVESHEPANRQSAPSNFIPPVAKDQPHAQNDHRNGSCTKRHFAASLLDLELCSFRREASKLPALSAGAIQHLQLQHACQVFLQKRADLSRLILNAVCRLF